ncbi:AAA family ATPase [Agrobacterium sp. 22-223-1]
MKISYSVDNLRRISSMPMIEIRPLTILLGRNSAGKSTFLRSLPLLRQSIETNSSAPILWYGDYVDFGNYRSAVSDNDFDRKITFSFSIDEFSRSAAAPEIFTLKHPRSATKEVNYGNVKVRYIVAGDGDGTYRDKIVIELPEITTSLSVGFLKGQELSHQIFLNGNEVKGITENNVIYFQDEQLFSPFIFFSRGKDGRLTAESRRDIFRRLIEREISNYDGRVGRQRISTEANRILEKRSLTDDSLEELSKTDTQTFMQYYKQLLNGWDPQRRLRIDELCRTHHAFNVLDALSSSLTSLFRSVEYIGPARARSERFYRQQELEVSEISPDGRNLPMFLASLPSQRLEKFSSWVEKIFGYGVSVHKTEGHLSINLEFGGKSVNVLDTGYGVSQVLPVLTQIWWMQQSQRYGRGRVRPNGFNTKTLLIEQPELHLHPAHQALLADVFVEALKDNVSPVSFVVETHSESLINRLGEIIAQGVIPPENVQIAIFGEDDNESPDQVRIATFAPDGTLKNWPFGFFNY